MYFCGIIQSEYVHNGHVKQIKLSFKEHTKTFLKTFPTNAVKKDVLQNVWMISAYSYTLDILEKKNSRYIIVGSQGSRRF